MKNFLIILLLTLPVAGFTQGFAVVELFTSQGCSSCPAADKNLTQLLKDSEKNGGGVFALSFHVDYWNHIGWKDPYSSWSFTERQKKYAGVMALSSIYTPQMIVNGESEFVGSDLSKARDIVSTAIRKEQGLKIQISNLVFADGVASFDYALNQDFSKAKLNAAVVAHHVENFVPRGENNGKTLQHDNVVMEFITRSLKQNDHLRMKVPSKAGDSPSVILYIQDENLKILAATSAPLR